MNSEKEKMQKVKLLVEALDNVSQHDLMISRQERFRNLTLKHSVQLVALAAGLTVSSLSQYLRVKHPSAIGERAIAQAEKILKQL